MTERLPSEIKTNIIGYKILLRILDRCRQTKDKVIILDFSEVRFIEANLSAIIATIIEIARNEGKSVKMVGFQPSVELILRKNRFLEDYGFSSTIDVHQTSVQYQKFDPAKQEDDINFSNYIEKQLLKKEGFPTLSPGLVKQIGMRIFELYENARTHGWCKAVHACGQYFPKSPSKPLNVTIVDTGRNFQENVSKYLRRPVEAKNAIHWAMQPGHTTKTGNHPGGLGLDLILQFIRLNKGRLQIVSSNGYWQYENDKVTTQTLPHHFNGTIANLRFNLDDDSQYKLVDEVGFDFENPF